MKLTEEKAFELLIEGVIDKYDDYYKPENKWLMHCLYVGIAASRIAERLNLDEDYYKALGYIHDIGRKVDNKNHVIAGYNYLVKKGYEKEAEICLTHSFLENNIEITAGGGPKNIDTYIFIDEYLKKTPPTLTDDIIRMCDLFCHSTGFTTVENRLLDISKRKGTYPNSLLHVEKTYELKERLELMMGCSLYSLFPEISKKDLEQVESDKKELMYLVTNPNKKLIKTNK